MTEHVSRRLVLVRHAKSDWPEVYDHERPLAAVGRRAAPAVGTWLREHDVVPDLVVCSTARRVRETWDLIAGTLGGLPEVQFDERVYDAEVPELLEVVHELPDHAVTAMLVGHNPGFHELATTLAGSAEDDALERVTRSSRPPRSRCSPTPDRGPRSVPAPPCSPTSQCPAARSGGTWRTRGLVLGP